MPRGRSHRSALATVHETTRRPRDDVTTIDRVPVTRPARTLVDLAGCVSRTALEEATLGWLVLPATPVELAGPGDRLAGEVAAAIEHAHAARACG